MINPAYIVTALPLSAMGVSQSEAMAPASGGGWLLTMLAVVLITTVLIQGLLSLYAFFRRITQQEQIYRSEKALWDQKVESALQSKVQQQQAEQYWSGYRKFEVRRKIREAENIMSFYLTPHDRKPLPLFQPGQYLRFRLNIPGQRKPVIRCYSLSDAPKPEYYRVTIKYCPPPEDKPDANPGLASNYFHNVVKEGDILDVSAPTGHFHLSELDDRPVVLIAGGVGLTPLLSMLNSIHAQGRGREAWLFYGVNTASEVIMQEHLQTLARDNNQFHLRLCYSDPSWRDVVIMREHLRKQAEQNNHLGQRLNYGFNHRRKQQDPSHKDAQHIGRISIGLLRDELPASNYLFYICGPTPMMKDLVAGLLDWGVPEGDIFYEAFNPGHVKPNAEAAAQLPSSNLDVTFSKSGKTLKWDPQASSLLEFADHNAIPMEVGCRAGNCGTCLVAILAGEVTYVSEPEQAPEAGSCLPCIAVPKTHLTLDA